MTYFDCFGFGLDGSIEFHVYAVKISLKQYSLEDMTSLQISLLTYLKNLFKNF